MGRKKIDIKYISSEKTRRATAAKRKLGLFKKAFELGELCGYDVAVVLMEDEKVTTFASSDFDVLMSRFSARVERGDQILHQNPDSMRFRSFPDLSNVSEYIALPTVLNNYPPGESNPIASLSHQYYFD